MPMRAMLVVDMGIACTHNTTHHFKKKKKILCVQSGGNPALIPLGTIVASYLLIILLFH